MPSSIIPEVVLPVAVQRFLEQERLTPFQNNVTVCFLSVIAFKLAQEAIVWLRIRFGIGVTYSKPAMYMALSLGLLFWPLFDVDNWSWRLNTILPLAMLVRFVYKVRKFIDKIGRTACVSTTPTYIKTVVVVQSYWKCACSQIMFAMYF